LSSRSWAPAVSRGLVVALVAAAGAVLFYEGCESRTIEVPTGYSGEAATNRYLAAERLLQAMGADVRRIADTNQLSELPPLDGTLILPVHRAPLSSAWSARLLDWVHRGGHLIVVTWTIWDDPDRTPDPILDAIDVHQYMHELDDEDDEEQLDDDVREAAEPELAQIEFPGRDAPLVAEFDPWFYFAPSTRDGAFAAGDVYGIHLLTLPVGAGSVTALTDDYVLANPGSSFAGAPSISDHDHAELLWRLVRWNDRTGPVWIVPRASHAGFFGLVWRYGWAAVISLGALLVVWLLAASARRGPLQPDDPIDRRSLMEHIEAVGRFHWANGSEEALVQSTRDALMATLTVRHPGWSRLDPAAQAARLAEHAGLAEDVVARALAPRSAGGDERFAERIDIMERIRKAL